MFPCQFSSASFDGKRTIFWKGIIFNHSNKGSNFFWKFNCCLQKENAKKDVTYIYVKMSLHICKQWVDCFLNYDNIDVLSFKHSFHMWHILMIDKNRYIKNPVPVHNFFRHCVNWTFLCILIDGNVSSTLYSHWNSLYFLIGHKEHGMCSRSFTFIPLKYDGWHWRYDGVSTTIRSMSFICRRYMAAMTLTMCQVHLIT